MHAVLELEKKKSELEKQSVEASTNPVFRPVRLNTTNGLQDWQLTLTLVQSQQRWFLKSVFKGIKSVYTTFEFSFVVRRVIVL